MKLTLLAAALTTAATAAFAAPENYTLDGGHSQIVLSYSHIGASTSYAMFSGFEGELMLDQDDPSKSSILVTIPAASMLTGWEPRSEHLLKSGEFFKLDDFPVATFQSTNVEVTGEKTAKITGDLTLNGVTKPIVLDAVLNAVIAEYPFPPYAGKPAAGFSATTTLMRSDFDLGLYVPYIGDEVKLEMSIEAMKLGE